MNNQKLNAQDQDDKSKSPTPNANPTPAPADPAANAPEPTDDQSANSPAAAAAPAASGTAAPVDPASKSGAPAASGTAAAAGSSTQQQEVTKNKISNIANLPKVGDKGRGAFLKEEYVKSHKQAKEDDKNALEQMRQTLGVKPTQKSADPGSTDSSKLQAADTIIDWVGTAAGHATDIGSVVFDGMDYANRNSPDADAYSSAGDIFGTVSGGVNSIFNGYSAVRSIMSTHQNRKNGNKVGTTAGIFESAGNILQTGSSLATMSAGIGGLASQKNSAGNIGNIVSGSLGALGSLSSLGGSSYRTHQYRTGRNALNSKKISGDDQGYKDSKTTRDNARQKLNSDKKTAEDYNAYEEERSKRQGMKARRYAAEMGAAKADMNYKAAGWDTLANTASVLSNLTSLGAGISGLVQNPLSKMINTVVGAALNLIPTIAKAKNTGSALRRGAQNRDKFINEYISPKAKALREASDKQITDASKKLTDGEIENIIIARLGVDPNADIEATSTKDAKKDAIFDKLCEKRANYILSADEGTRKDLLGAMGLSPDATLAAVKEALGG